MTTPFDAPAGIGHNSRAYFADALAAQLKGADVWATRPTLDADTAPRARDFVAGLKKLFKEADEARKTEKAPHTEAAKAVDDGWRPTLTAIERTLNGIEPKLATFLRAEKAKADAAKAEADRQRRAAEAQVLAAQEAAARAQTESAKIVALAEADAAAAAAKRAADAAAAPPVRVDSATGLARRAGLRTVRKARIDDLGRALLHYRTRPEVAALIEQLANAEIRAAKGVPLTIPGVTVVETQELSA